MRRTLTLIFAVSLSMSISSSAGADDKASGATLESTRATTLSSSAIDQDYRIHVALPYGYESSEESYPVAYLLDSDVLFGLVTDIARLLPLEGVPTFLGKVRVPELIVVGIGYPGGVAEMSNRRGRDMNPPEGEKGEVNPEGAANFYRFLREDLIPWVESSYRAQAADRTLIGVSRGGVFVLSTLFLHPETFQRYVAVSPVIEPPIYKYFETYSARDGSTRARLFLSAGSAGELETGIAAGVSRLTQRLDELGTERLEWNFKSFNGESHVSVVPKALVEALISVFSEPVPPGQGAGPPDR